MAETRKERIAAEIGTGENAMDAAIALVMKVQDAMAWLISNGAKPTADMMEDHTYGMKDAVPLVAVPTMRVRKDDKWAGDRCPMCHAAFEHRTYEGVRSGHAKLMQALSDARASAVDLGDMLQTAGKDSARWQHIAEHAQQDLANQEESAHLAARAVSPPANDSIPTSHDAVEATDEHT